ncbi:MAG: cysteine synthase A [Spirochaetales bacterium]|nr:cysteine synthase A [Spirochaetales bacterium]
MQNSIVQDLTELVGHTPLLRLSRFAPTGNVLIKLELLNPGSSVKDRIALAMVETAEKSGKIERGATLIEPTSGNTGIGLAWVAAVKGYKLILTMPESMSIERRKLLQALGAEIVLTPGNEGMTGAMAKAEELLQRIPGSFQPSQFSNPANPEAHYKTTGPEIWEACKGKVDILVAGVGTGGTLSGTGRFLKEQNPELQVIAVEPTTSAVISGKAAGPHMIQGIGGGFIPDNLDRSLLTEVFLVDSMQAIEAAKELALHEGLLAGISTGANVWAARKVAERPENRSKTVVTIACDTGERYISTLLFYHD